MAMDRDLRSRRAGSAPVGSRRLGSGAVAALLERFSRGSDTASLLTGQRAVGRRPVASVDARRRVRTNGTCEDELVFEAMVSGGRSAYPASHARYAHLFQSEYESLGPRHARGCGVC